MVTDEELGEGGYRVQDLLDRRIVTSRTDLQRKQKQHEFPKPVKIGTRQIWFPVAEVNAWLRKRMKERDNKQAAETEATTTKSDSTAR